MPFVGLDVHRRRTQVAVLDDEGHELFNRNVVNDILGVEVRSPFNGTSGAEIVGLVPSGAAEAAGLSTGDVITGFDGQPVSSPGSLTDLLLGAKPGATVQVQYLDPSGLQHQVNVTLASGPPQ